MVLEIRIVVILQNRTVNGKGQKRDSGNVVS